ncbi:MAG TPA: hypothetical protein VMH77_07035, partial [Steroidobacteraceae bacterium]|nr:hypothetical protein [Steroidobacteraceae bacterium]
PLNLRPMLGTDLDALQERSPDSHAAAIKARVLMMYQPGDDQAPAEQSSRMRAVLKEAGNAPLLEPIGLDYSGYFTPPLRATVYQRILDFLDENIGKREQCADEKAPECRSNSPVTRPRGPRN